VSNTFGKPLATVAGEQKSV